LVLNREQNLLREKNRFRKKKYDFWSNATHYCVFSLPTSLSCLCCSV
jgi:hypothetical protein